LSPRYGGVKVVDAMVLYSRVTWEKIALEMELLGSEEPRSLIPLVLGVQSVLRGDEHQDWCARRISFLSFELAAQCDELTELERLARLNEFFFNTQGFVVLPERSAESQYSLRPFLVEKKSSAIMVALLYLHLAAQLGLRMSFARSATWSILKWHRSDGRCDYIDVAQAGETLSADQLLALMGGTSAPLETVMLKDVMLSFLRQLTIVYANAGERDLSHATLSMMLKIEPNNLSLLCERALLRLKMGFDKEALADLKRYLAFSELGSAPVELQRLFHESTERGPTLPLNPETIH
jgi:regulator of sirC expression with transglutaminase-like and TPR domain